MGQIFKVENGKIFKGKMGQIFKVERERERERGAVIRGL